jgi:hypothetical protein
MEEVKVRLEAIESALSGATNLSPPFIQDFCYLELRLIAELIALACLLAHGDIPAAQSSVLRGSWDADKIIKTLTNIHPEFFPYPVKREHLSDGSVHMNDVASGYLTRDEMLEFLGRIGNKLHRGSLKNMLKNRHTVQNNFPDIVKWHDKIVLLLNEHRIMFADKRTLYYVALKEASMGERVAVFLVEAPPVAPLEAG